MNTSLEAYLSLDINGLKRKVYDCIKEFGDEGCISDEVADKLSDLSYSSYTARYSQLYKDGLIEYTGEKRKGKSGRNQRVMVAVIPNE